MNGSMGDEKTMNAGHGSGYALNVGDSFGQYQTIRQLGRGVVKETPADAPELANSKYHVTGKLITESFWRDSE